MQFMLTLCKSATHVMAMAFIASLFLTGCGSGGGGSVSGGSGVALPALNIITITPDSVTVFNGQSKKFTASGLFADGSISDITSQVSWSSDNTGVVTINSNTGVATGVTSGNATVTASMNGVTSNNASLTVKQLTAISINPATATVATGLITKFTATANFSDGSTANITNQVTWATGDSAVATIDSATGIATGVRAGGITTVTASASGIVSASASLSVTSSTAILNGISITPATQSAPKGTSVIYTATGSYSDGNFGDISGSVVWASSNTSVATVNGTGIASTLAVGATTVSASASGVNSNSVTLNVTAPALTKITINPASATVPKWLTTNFTAAGIYTDGSVADITSQVNWATGDSKIATINSSTGAATGVLVGATTVTASAGGITSADASLSVTVAALTEITIASTTLSAPKGMHVVFSATGTYSDNSTADASGQVSWSSSDISVATINNSGYVTALKQGSTTITASASGLASNSVILTVTDPVLTAISINPNSAAVAKGLTTNFTAIGTYSDTTTADISAKVKWGVDDPAIASINIATGAATGMALGGTTVTALADGITSPGASLYVTAATLTGISITPVTQSVSKGTPVTFTATGSYSDGNSGDVSGLVT